ncbi:MAG: double-strand break repair helicase AddA [Rhizobiaceae bacterium]
MAELIVPQKTQEDQHRAANPESSAWVSANAGSGKTYVLALRVIHLMLSGTAPSRILCLTFTKAAAAEMSNRVFEKLSHWAMLDDAALTKEITKVTGQPATAKVLRRGRQLFALALDTPGGLKIQTVHAFCEALLHQFPLEANVSGHFQVLDDFAQNALLEESRKRILLKANRGDEALSGAFDLAMNYGSDDAMFKALDTLVSKREAFLDWADIGIDAAMAPMFEHFQLTMDSQLEDIELQSLALTSISDEQWLAIANLAKEIGGTRNQEAALSIEQFLATREPARKSSLRSKLLLTKSGTPRASVFTKAVNEQMPELPELIMEETANHLAGIEKIKTWKMLGGSRALFKIALETLETYGRLKHSRGFVDYDDLINRAANLLMRSEIRQWVQYKLDRGIDHLLIDEAQDTSPRQWQIVNAITEDFHSGETASLRTRTVFAVGDEKQSIYSFQGAEPEAFERQARALKKRVAQSGKNFETVNLHLSFRSTKAVLSAVDKVFESSENAKGLNHDGASTIHESIRGNDPGLVEVWPLYEKEKTDKPSEWLAPLDHQTTEDPAVVLANRIAQTIKTWIGTPLEGTGNPIRHGDILVLVRKRDRFATALTRAMKNEGLAVAGSDRLKLTEHIAVEDLLALGRFVLMPKDDLSLAAFLKSPIIGVSEQTLFELSVDRKKRSLWHHISYLANENNKSAKVIFEKIKRLLESSKTLPVFEFYALLLGPMGGRKAFMHHLGNEVEEILDEFLNQCLTYDQIGRRGLEDFIGRLTGSAPDIKRELDLGRNEIRIMTVHASKGLEAPIVFLVDSCGPAFGANHRPAVMKVQIEDDEFFLWQPTKSDGIEATQSSLALVEQRAEEEYRRLLYVGMTRAADRLIVCGYKRSGDLKYSHWHPMVWRALEGEGREILDADGVIAAIQWVGNEICTAREPIPHESVKKPLAVPLPDWILAKPRFELPPPRPLTPSGAHFTIDEDIGNVRYAPSQISHADAALRGTVSHKLLQYLPEYAPDQRQSVAEQYIERLGLNRDVARKLVVDVMAILEHRDFAPIFSDNSQAEVSIAGHINLKSGRRLISGQIDRLLVEDDCIWVIDYKTGRQIPANAAEISGSYLSQLALYQHIIAKVYPDRPVKCALLWSEGPILMPVNDASLAKQLEIIINESASAS